MNPRFLLLSTSLAFLSCNASPPIGPDPIDASMTETSSSSSAASSSSSSTSGSSSSASSSGGGPQGDGSGGRLKRYMYRSADGLLLSSPGRLYDSTLGLDCAPYPTALGTRCLPSAPLFSMQHFADTECLIPIVYSYKGCVGAAYYLAPAATTCGYSERSLHTISKTPVVITYERLADNTCTTTNFDLSAFDAYTIGPEVDYAQFAPMTLEHE